MTLQAAFVLAVAFGCVAAFMGSRTALALLAGTAVQTALALARVPFIPPVWMMIDLGVILAIIHPKMTNVDCIVLALFVPAWALYFVDGDAAYAGSVLVCSTQLVLSFPGAKALAGYRKFIDTIRGGDEPLAFAGVWLGAR